MADRDDDTEDDPFGTLDEDEYVPPGEAAEAPPSEGTDDPEPDQEPQGTFGGAPDEADTGEDLDLDDIVESDPEPGPTEEDLRVDEVLEEAERRDPSEEDLDVDDVVAERDEPAEDDLDVGDVITSEETVEAGAGTEQVVSETEEPGYDDAFEEAGPDDALDDTRFEAPVTESPVGADEPASAEETETPEARRARIGLGLVTSGLVLTTAGLAGTIWYFFAARDAFVGVAGTNVALWILFAVPAVAGIVLMAFGQAMRPAVERAKERLESTGEFEEEVDSLFRLGLGWHLVRFGGLGLLLGGGFLWFQYRVQVGEELFILAFRGLEWPSTTVFSALALLGIVLIVLVSAVRASRSRLKDRVLLAYQDREIDRLKGED